jgi:hypothetical protein
MLQGRVGMKNVYDYEGYGSGIAIQEMLYNFLVNFGTYPVSVFVFDAACIIKKQKLGAVQKLKLLLRSSATLASAILGVILPVVIFPQIANNVGEAITMIFGFGGGLSYYCGVAAIIWFTSACGALLANQALNIVMNRIFETPNTNLHFTQSELQDIIDSPRNPFTSDNRKDLDDAVEFLQNEYLRLRGDTYQGQYTLRELEILSIADAVREGDLDPLYRYISKQVTDLELKLTENNSDFKEKLSRRIKLMVEQFDSLELLVMLSNKTLKRISKSEVKPTSTHPDYPTYKKLQALINEISEPAQSIVAVGIFSESPKILPAFKRENLSKLETAESQRLVEARKLLSPYKLLSSKFIRVM